MPSRQRDVYSFKNNNSNNYLVDICCVQGIAYCDRHRTRTKGQRVERTRPAQGTGSSWFCLDGPPAWRVVWWETSQVVFPEKRTQRCRLASRLLIWERPQGQHLWRKQGGKWDCAQAEAELWCCPYWGSPTGRSGPGVARNCRLCLELKIGTF